MVGALLYALRVTLPDGRRWGHAAAGNWKECWSSAPWRCRDQQVLGRGGLSVFGFHMLKAFREGHADNNADGYVSVAELTSYVVPRASNQYQTPAFYPILVTGEGCVLSMRPPRSQVGLRPNTILSM